MDGIPGASAWPHRGPGRSILSEKHHSRMASKRVGEGDAHPLQTPPPLLYTSEGRRETTKRANYSSFTARSNASLKESEYSSSPTGSSSTTGWYDANARARLRTRPRGTYCTR